MFLKLHFQKTLCALLILTPLVSIGFSQESSEDSPNGIDETSIRIPRNAHMAFWIDDVSEAREQSSENAWVKLMLNEESGVSNSDRTITEVLSRAPLSPADPLFPVWSLLLPIIDTGTRSGLDSARAVFKLDTQELFETFDGSLAVFSTMYDLYVDNDTEIVEWDVILAAEYEENDKEKIEGFLEKALEKVPSSPNKEKREYWGFDVFHIEYYLESEAELNDELGLGLVQEIPVIIEYAYVDGYFLLAEGRGDPLKSAIRAVSDAGEGIRLSDTLEYRRLSTVMGEERGQYNLYFSLPLHVNEYRELPSLKNNVALLSSLGLARTSPLLVNATLNKDRTNLKAVLRAGTENNGIFSIMSEDPGDFQKVLSLPSDSQLVGTIQVNMAQLWQQLLNISTFSQPRQKRIAELMLNAVNETAGINIYEELLSGNDGELLSYVRPGGDNGTNGNSDPSASFIFPMRNSRQVETFNELITFFHGEEMKLLQLEKEEFNGYTLWETPEAEQTSRRSRLHFSATPNGLIFANSGSELREMVRRLTSSDPSSTIQENEAFKRFFDEEVTELTRGFVFQPASTIQEQYRNIVRYQKGLKTDTDAIEELITNSVGNTWWKINSTDDGFLFEINVDQP